MKGLSRQIKKKITEQNKTLKCPTYFIPNTCVFAQGIFNPYIRFKKFKSFNYSIIAPGDGFCT